MPKMEQIDLRRRLRVPAVSVGDRLTDRELDILKQIFSGKCSSEVATTLQVSKRTVDFHLAKAYAKMGVTNRYDAFRKAVELGIISE